MKPLSILLAALAVALSACATSGDATAGSPDPAHSSRNALDWAGTYEGVMPCADCPGIKTRLTLRQDGSYEVTSEYIDRKAATRVERGKFVWLPGGNAVQLEGEARGQRFAVGEGRLAWLEPGAAAAWPQPARYVLTLAAKEAKGAKGAQGLQGTLESHRWTLAAATDAGGKPLPGLAANPARPIVFHFAGDRLSIEGGCNRSFGGYQIDADGRLVVNRMASTMMACDPALMKIDDELATLLAASMKIELTQGETPTLRLADAKSGTLAFTGSLTPEARYGTPARVFLEVAPQTVACSNPPAGATSCLQVREIAFDNKGLRIEPPGAWRALHENIEGYTHQSGVRNVLRLKRFQDKSGGPVYVLDMVVESGGTVR
ncbi:MAG TPA: copper resistance protein NlpE N-terminal domain-containing protein [Burkholderiaceae bacterium]|nr:copper resistance protein NlpE N-terminal domain-containing protein [Burkholderiaceae bacterium]